MFLESYIENIRNDYVIFEKWQRLYQQYIFYKSEMEFDMFM